MHEIEVWSGVADRSSRGDDFAWAPGSAPVTASEREELAAGELARGGMQRNSVDVLRNCGRGDGVRNGDDD